MVSRETMVMDLCTQDDRLQYDGNDDNRIAGIAAQFTQTAMLMIEAMGAFNKAAEAPVDENSEDLMKGARCDIVMSWAALQAVTSKIAGIFRIDADTAFERVLTAASKDEDPDVAGL